MANISARHQVLNAMSLLKKKKGTFSWSGSNRWGRGFSSCRLLSRRTSGSHSGDFCSYGNNWGSLARVAPFWNRLFRVA